MTTHEGVRGATALSEGSATRPPLRRIALLDDFGDAARASADWSGLPVEVFTDHVAGPTLVERLRGFDAVVLIRERSPFPADLVGALPELRLVVTTGMRNRVLDMAACDARGIPVCGTPSSAAPTVELAWGLILGLARRIPPQEAALRQGRWQAEAPGLELEGATLGVAGLGRIGVRVTAIARAFGMKVLAWSPNMTPERAAAAGTEAVSKHDLFARSDIVSLHLGLGPTTRGIVGARELAAMKPGALLVNTSRGALVDEAALLAALHEGRLGGAAIDVFEEEPLPQGHPLLAAPNTLLTPHLGYVSARNYRAYFEGATACLRAWNAGAPLPNPLNAAAGAPTAQDPHA